MLVCLGYGWLGLCAVNMYRYIFYMYIYSFTRHEAEEQELTSKVVALETELSRANELLTASKGRTLPLSETEVLSLSPAVSRASSMLKSGSLQCI